MTSESPDAPARIAGDVAELPACAACEDTGLVAPDAFADWVPWHRYLAECKARHFREGWPPESSAILAGLITSMPCPKCQGGEP